MLNGDLATVVEPLKGGAIAIVIGNGNLLEQVQRVGFDSNAEFNTLVSYV